MEASKNSFENVLKKAQSLGYAEPGNPKLDLNGYDALKAKILLHCRLIANIDQSIEWKELKILNTKISK